MVVIRNKVFQAYFNAISFYNKEITYEINLAYCPTKDNVLGLLPKSNQWKGFKVLEKPFGSPWYHE